jgi:para-nitrobenzyl esterase
VTSAPTAGGPTVSVSTGTLRGRELGGVASFKGVPFAAPPEGELRFAAPASPIPWVGVRDARRYGPTPPKPPYPAPFDALLVDPAIEGNEVLNLNVWTPSDALGPHRDHGLPVMVWIHGGAFRSGTGAVEIYDGAAFARDGIVCVTFNYRLGMDGFGLFPDAPPNRGILDQVAALRWVRDEIAAFGGDPGRVTIAGESAGAMSALMLMASPGAIGLFHGVIAQSGAGHHAQSAESAERVAAALGVRLGVAPTARGFATVPTADFIAAQVRLAQEITTTDRASWGPLALDGMPYEPVVDGELIPHRPIDTLRRADPSSDVPVLIGANAEEYRFWLVPLGQIDHVSVGAVAATGAALGLSAERMAPYLGAPTPGVGLERLMSDWFFRIPALRVAEVRWGGPGATYLYDFQWRSPAVDGDLGAAHAVELAFVFDTVGVPSGWGMIGEDAPRALATEMHAAWVAFVRDGTPGWAPYEAGRRTVRVFGGSRGPGAVEHDPLSTRRELWNGVR